MVTVPQRDEPGTTLTGSTSSAPTSRRRYASSSPRARASAIFASTGLAGSNCCSPPVVDGSVWTGCAIGGHSLLRRRRAVQRAGPSAVAQGVSVRLPRAQHVGQIEPHGLLQLLVGARGGLAVGPPPDEL